MMYLNEQKVVMRQRIEISQYKSLHLLTHEYVKNNLKDEDVDFKASVRLLKILPKMSFSQKPPIWGQQA